MSYKLEKEILKSKYGKKCMLCGRKLKDNQCTFHHIIPKSYNGETSVKNGAILCQECQKIIHLFDYNETGYIKLTYVILKNKGGK